MRNDTARQNEQGIRKAIQLDFFTDLLAEIDAQTDTRRVVDIQNFSKSKQIKLFGICNTKHDGCIAQQKPSSNVQPSTERWQDGQDIPNESTGTGRPSDAASLPGRENGRTTWDNQTGYGAETENTDQSSKDLNPSCQLNPRLSAWLMDYPEDWCSAAVIASRSMPTKRKKRE